MNARGLSAFSLTYLAIGSPGTGCRVRLSVTVTGGNIQVQDALPDEGPEFRRRMLIAVSKGWRGVLEYLVNNEITAFVTDGDTRGEYPWPLLMELRGRPSVVTDMISLAWAGPPLTTIAQALARLSDGQLAALRKKHGSLISEHFIDEMQRVDRWCDDVFVDMDDVIDCAQIHDFDFRGMRKDVIRIGRAQRAAEAEARRIRDEQLAPFAAQIATIVKNWRRKNPPTSTNTQMGFGMRSGALLASLEAYAIQHRRLPEGRFTVSGSSRLSSFDVDLALLSQNGSTEPSR